MSTKTDIPISRAAAAQQTPVQGSWPGFGILRSEMERLFDAFEPNLWPSRALADIWPGTEASLSPAIDLTENAKGYSISAELPGLRADQVSVKISNGTLTICGEKAEEERQDDDTYHLRERRWGSFRRSVRLPEDVDRDKVEAEFSGGVLKISLPKSADALASERNVAINAA
ncbi:Hsp20/alpha crystallin family protein [Poseidonocella sp. HB161398]|uniref:Hsp20/alpha crystallin family protein n=1 Tax=Poseidonocella sp. HB161398 TaxID=2320855 RepID=UPI001486CD6C|nr:Hsp20/alpha crystallin family protein [Poseidonocella sp. HB161398]